MAACRVVSGSAPCWNLGENRRCITPMVVDQPKIVFGGRNSRLRQREDFKQVLYRQVEIMAARCTKKIVVVAVVMVVVVAAVAGGVGGYLSSLLAFPPFPVYRTDIVSTPGNTHMCINNSSSDKDLPPVALELMDLASDVVYVAAGDDPISQEEFNSIKVSLPFLKNTNRHLLFNESCFFSSPTNDLSDCSGMSCFSFRTFLSHSWLAMAGAYQQTCFPSSNGCRLDAVDPGFVSITTINKCQVVTFLGPHIYVLSDGKGNKFVMHATKDGIVRAENGVNVQLPSGFAIEREFISQPLILYPRGENSCYYNILRDNEVQSYHQFDFSSNSSPIADLEMR